MQMKLFFNTADCVLQDCVFHGKTGKTFRNHVARIFNWFQQSTIFKKTSISGVTGVLIRTDKLQSVTFRLVTSRKIVIDKSDFPQIRHAPIRLLTFLFSLFKVGTRASELGILSVILALLRLFSSGAIQTVRNAYVPTSE